MRQISSSFWKYADYLAQKHSSFRCEVTRPNKMACAGAESPNFDEKGFLSDDPTPGRMAYESNGAYRGAMELLVKAAELPAREDFRKTCMYKLGNYFNERVVGPYAEIKKMSCVPNGRSASGATTTDLYLGENGAVKTYATLMNEKATRARMTKEALNAAAWSDAVAYIPVVGTLEDGAKCLGMDSTVVTEIYHKVGTGDLRDSAILAGWRPEPPGDASIADTAMTCIGALPIAATAGKVVKGGAKVFKNGRALTATAAKSGEMFELFRRALNPSEYATAYASIARKFPDNKDLLKLVEVVSKTLENADAMKSTVSGVASLGSEYLPQYFGAQ